MSNPRATTARLRRRFRYPNEDDSDGEPEAMDEQEQESFIAHLVAENASRNNTFRLALLALPLLSTVPYLTLLVSRSGGGNGGGNGGGGGGSTAFVSLLALTSLLATAYLLHRLPPTVTGIGPLDAWSRNEDVGAATRDARAWLRSRGARRGGAAAGVLDDGRSPLDLYLPYLNVVLVAMLALMGLATGRGAGSFGWVGVGNLPGLVYAVVLVSKIVMGSVDPEKELSALKYRFKGA